MFCFLQAPSADHVRCDKISMFKIEHSRDRDNYWHPTFARSHDTNKTIFNLRSNTLYRVRVAAINNRDLEGYSEIAMVRTSGACKLFFRFDKGAEYSFAINAEILKITTHKYCSLIVSCISTGNRYG